MVPLGIALVVVCVLGFALLVVNLGDRDNVLVVTRPVAAGQLITDGDLGEVLAAADASLELVPATKRARVVGRPAAVPLLAGMPVTKAVLGDAVFPPAGQVAASVALKPGHFPQGLPVGSSVLVYIAQPGTAGKPASPTSTTGVVLTVSEADGPSGATVVTLLVPTSAASLFAAADTDAVTLMQTTPGGG